MTAKNIDLIEKEIAGTLKAARTLNSLTQKNIAEIIGLTANNIEAFEDGREAISAANLFIIAGFLNIPIENFFIKPELPYSPEEESLDAEAFNFLSIFSGVESTQVRKKIIELCMLYEDLQK